MAQLAIKGHPNRGKEVIEILKMLGGQNYSQNLLGGTEYNYYYIGNYSTISCIPKEKIDSSFVKFTLEEFLEKFPYKVGDKVLYKNYGIYSKIKSMLWNEEKEQVFYRLESNKLFVATADELKPYKEDAMEGKVESFEILESHCADEVKIEFDPFKFEIVERDNGYYVVKKKTQYPKTLEECCKIINTLPHTRNGVSGYASGKLWALQKLLICRDAYWKIAGEEMGLEKPWKPVLGENFIYAIGTCYGTIEKRMVTGGSGILLFPTEEMRDSFKENFMDLIEQCKELL